MPTAHQDRLYGNVVADRVYGVKFATPGFPFINAGIVYESLSPAYRYSANFSLVSQGPEVVDKTTAYDGALATLSLESAATTLAEVKNFYIQWRGAFQAQMYTASGQYFNFIAEAGTIDTPTASQLMGGSWEWMIDDTRRTLNLNAMTYLTGPEASWLITNSGTAQTGGTGGTSNSLTQTSATTASFRRAGFKVGGLSINGVVAGILEKGGNSIRISSVSSGPDERGRPINTAVATEAKFLLRQTALNDMLAVLTDREQEYTIIASTLAGETFKWTTGASSIDYNIVKQDDKSYIELSLKSEHPIISGTNSIDWGVGTATQVEFKRYAWA